MTVILIITSIILVYYIIPVVYNVVRLVTDKYFLSYLIYFVQYVNDGSGELNVLIDKFKLAITSVGSVPDSTGTKAAARLLVKADLNKQESCINVMHELINSIK